MRRSDRSCLQVLRFARSIVNNSEGIPSEARFSRRNRTSSLDTHAWRVQGVGRDEALTPTKVLVRCFLLIDVVIFAPFPSIQRNRFPFAALDLLPFSLLVARARSKPVDAWRMVSMLPFYALSGEHAGDSDPSNDKHFDT